MADLKTLVVCLSTDLPTEADRDVNFIYFVYNTLTLFMGKAVYGENFCIVDSMPNEPDIDRLYICLDDGKVKVYDDYEIIEIGEVQTREMLNILSQAGTLYYFNSKERYIDRNERLLVLPFNNGEYRMVIDGPGDLLYNDNTVVKYNSDSERFEIYGETYDEDPLDTKGFRGHETDSVKIDVKDGRIEGNVKISQGDGNLIRVVEDGLYVAVKDAITNKEFDSWKSGYDLYKSQIEGYVASIEENIEKIKDIISEEVINEKIQYYLEQVYPTIDEAIEQYEVLNQTILSALDSYEVYANTRFNEIESELRAKVEEALEHPWGDLDAQEVPDTVFLTLATAIYISEEETP